MILFYGNWFQFSSKAAPSFNAMPRYFPKLNFYAIEVANNLNIFSQFAVVALPSVLGKFYISGSLMLEKKRFVKN